MLIFAAEFRKVSHTVKTVKSMKKNFFDTELGSIVLGACVVAVTYVMFFIGAIL